MTDWKPIATAPAEEFMHVILIARDNGKRCVMPAYFDGDDWKVLTLVGPMKFVNPTHWMPLPAPPEQSDA